MPLLLVTGVAGKMLVDDGQTIAEIDNVEHLGSSSSSKLGDPIDNGEQIFLQVILKLMAKGARLKYFSRHANGPPTGPGLGRHRAGFHQWSRGTTCKTQAEKSRLGLLRKMAL